MNHVGKISSIELANMWWGLLLVCKRFLDYLTKKVITQWTYGWFPFNRINILIDNMHQILQCWMLEKKRCLTICLGLSRCIIILNTSSTRIKLPKDIHQASIITNLDPRNNNIQKPKRSCQALIRSPLSPKKITRNQVSCDLHKRSFIK